MPSCAPTSGFQSASPQDVLRTVPESYLLADKALVPVLVQQVKEPSRRTELSRMLGRKTRSKYTDFNPEVKASEIKLELT